MTIVPGETVGPYRVIEQLGSGGMATVFKAFHPSLDRYVAIKVLHPALKKDAQFFERFKREARIVAKLEHPNIIPVYDFNEHNHEPYLVMRFVEGSTLKPRMDETNLSSQQILSLMRPVCQAVDYAHRQGVLHRDLKPSNIMVSQEGNVFVTDFGLARIMQAGESTLSQDMMLGTPQYISPEQAQGVGELDGRTDVYSLGVILFEMTTGQVPFNADTPFATVHDHIYAPLPLPSAINPDIDPAVERLLLKALAKNPEDRFATAGDLLDALEKTMGAHMVSGPTAMATVLSRPGATLAEEGNRVKKNGGVPWWAWGGGAVAALIIIGVLAGLLLWRRANRPDSPAVIEPVATQVAGRDLPSQDEPVPFETVVSEPPLGSTAGDNQPAPQTDTGRSDRPPADKPAPSSDVDDPQTQQAIVLTRQANEARQRGQLGQAGELYRQAIELDPHFVPAYLGLSEVQRRQDNIAASLATLEEAVTNNPGSYEAYLKLGETYISSNEPESALLTFEQAAELEPNVAVPYAGQALALLILDQNAEAKQYIDEALTIDSNNPHARLVNAIYLYRQGDRRAALQETRRLFQEGDLADFDRERARKIFAALTGE